MTSIKERELTAKQEAFCSFIFQGKRQADAYRSAYDCQDMSDEAIYVEASRLADNPIVSLRIKELKARVSAFTIASVDDRKLKLTAILNSKIETPISAGHHIAAAKELNLMEKVYTEAQNRPQVVSISYIYNASPQSLQAISSPVIQEIEGKVLEEGKDA